MTLQVEGTNDSSCLSKFSAVERFYFNDEFLQYFVSRSPRRAPLIHLGYSVRAAIINTLLKEFVELGNSRKQIVSVGAGFDTLYFKIKNNYPDIDVVYHELDLPRVIERKIKCIQGSDVLQDVIGEFTVGEEGLASKGYKLLAVDLRDIRAVGDLLQKYKLDLNVETLFLSECAITYLEEDKSTELIKFASSLRDATFVTYEQIHPDDGFGRVMVQHFASLQSPLMSVERYPTLELQTQRYRTHSWPNCTCVSALDAYKDLISEAERSRVLSLEPFDEWEELYLKCLHYAVVIASKGSLSNWSRLCHGHTSQTDISQKKELIWKLVQSKSTCRYGHSIVKLHGNYLLIGGFGVRKDGTHGRMKDIVWLKQNGLQLSVLKETENSDFATMYASWTAVSNGSFIVYGGRTSPLKCAFQCPQLVTFLPDGRVKCEPLLESCERKARWRHIAVIVQRDAVETFLVFGGRTTNLEYLDDTWMVSLHPNLEDRKIIVVVESASIKPYSRFSHSASSTCTDSRNSEVWIHGGMASTGPLADVWCLNMATLQWRQLAVNGNIIPRFGHSTSIHNHSLVVVGGVSDRGNGQPPVSVINLEMGGVVHYKLPGMTPERSFLLINLCHVVSKDEKAIWIIGGGGNCFSFGTFFNSSCSVINLEELNL